MGLVVIYIGDGKGKTTAAVGLAVRAAGAGKKVLFTQFVKAATAKESGEWPLSSEIGILKKTKNVTVKVLGRGFVGILGDRKAKFDALALTGHDKYAPLVKAADLVTEMKMIKHPYYKGILAKLGIDY